MKLRIWFLALSLGACQVPAASADADMQQALDDLKLYQAQLEDENAQLQGQLNTLEFELELSRAERAHSAATDLESAFSDLKDAISGLAGSGSLEYIQGPDGPMVRIGDSVLFSSGSTAVSDSGKALLTSLAPELSSMGVAFRVEGHTDNEPVRKQSKRFPHGNLQLSAARAIEVAALLIQAGLPAEQVSVVGFGEHRPVDASEDRARNRRVEIVVIQAGAQD